MISTPRVARRVERRLLERHARADHDQVGAVERRGLVAAELELDAQRHAAARRRRTSRALSVSVTRAPRRASSSAAAMPLRAAPTTTTRRPSTEKSS